jgi:hypothetical protein
MSMTPPTSLPARAFLLSWDRERDKLNRHWLPHLLRAAALSDLWASGDIVDQDGHAAVAAGRPPSDPVLRDVWTEVGEAPARWRALVGRKRRETEDAVTEQLDAAGAIRIERAATRFRRPLLEVRNPLLFTRASDRFGAVLRSSERMTAADAALIGVLSVAGMRTAISKEQRREYADRIAKAVALGGPAVPALRHAISQARSSMSG